MAHKVLIIEDEEAAGKLIADALAPLSIEAVIHKAPKDGVAAFQAAPTSLVILDLFLPGTDGFKVAQQLRSFAPNVPIVFVSGVYKSQQVIKDVYTRFNAPLVAKPFALDDLRRPVAAALGIPFDGKKKDEPVRRAPPPKEQAAFAATAGDLRAKPFYSLLGELYRGRATGQLEIVREKSKRRLWFQRGYLVFAASNSRAENAGGMQVAAGQLQEQHLQLAVEHARRSQTALHDALVAVGAMTPAQIQLALKKQTEEVAIGACGLGDGAYTFSPLKEPLGVPDARHHPLAVAVGGVQRHYPPASMREYLQGRAGLKLYRSPELDRDLYTLKQFFAGETVTPLLNGKTTVSEALTKTKEPELPLLFALIGFGFAGFSPFEGSRETSAGPSAGPGHSAGPGTSAGPGQRAPSGTASAGPSGGPPRAPAGRGPVDPASEAARANLRQEHARISGADHYAVLGISRGAPDDEIKKAYISAAKRWHTDGFSGLDLGDTRQLAEGIFARVSEANQVLADVGKRTEYHIYLDRTAAGLPTDVAAIMQAEELFHKAQQLFKQNRFADAEAQLKQALKLNHAEAEFWAMAAACAWKLRGKAGAAETRSLLGKARALQAEVPLADLVEAQLLIGEGELEAGEKLLRKVLVERPDNQDALRELRALRDRKEKDAKSGGGLFGKLLKRK